jgi:hypothetical protein
MLGEKLLIRAANPEARGMSGTAMIQLLLPALHWPDARPGQRIRLPGAPFTPSTNWRLCDLYTQIVQSGSSGREKSRVSEEGL